MHTRLTWICHGLTSASRSGRFPLDEPLEETAIAKTRAMTDRLQRADRVLTSPALRARQTADALAFAALPDPLLADCDYGRWAGMTIADLQMQEPENLLAWTSDPEFAFHGGESVKQTRITGRRMDGNAISARRPRRRHKPCGNRPCRDRQCATGTAILFLAERCRTPVSRPHDL